MYPDMYIYMYIYIYVLYITYMVSAPVSLGPQRLGVSSAGSALPCAELRRRLLRLLRRTAAAVAAHGG